MWRISADAGDIVRRNPCAAIARSSGRIYGLRDLYASFDEVASDVLDTLPIVRAEERFKRPRRSLGIVGVEWTPRPLDAFWGVVPPCGLDESTLDKRLVQAVGTHDVVGRRIAGPRYGVAKRGDVPFYNFVQSEPASGSNHPSRFTIEPPLVGDVHGDVLRPNEVEGVIAEGEIKCIAREKGNRGKQTDALVQHPSGMDAACCNVEPDHLAAVLEGQRTGRAADAAADVERPLSRTEMGELREVAGSGASPNVHIIERREVIGREAPGVLA